MGVTSKVNVTVGVSVGGNVTSRVRGTGLGVFAAWVKATATLSVNSTFVGKVMNVLVGRGLLVAVMDRLGVKVGSGLVCVVGDDEAPASAVDRGPGRIKMNRVPAKSTSAIPLKMSPPSEGRSLKA